jgi:hypothetical protein
MDIAHHKFMTGDTIIAAIKKHNGYFLSTEQVELLLAKFRELNGSGPFRPGMEVVVPVMDFSS